MEDNSKPQSLISKEMKITGTIESSASLQIDGKLDGELHCSGDTTIGKEAKIKGNLEATSVTVAGSVEGNINAKDKIEMKSSAKVNGDIKAKRLAIEDGVSFVGKSEVNPSGEQMDRSDQKKDEGTEDAKAQKDKSKDNSQGASSSQQGKQ